MNDAIPIEAYSETTRVPPQAIDAEQGVLGGLMLDNSAWDRIGDVIQESDFYRGDHRVIYRAIEQLIGLGMPADALTVAESLGDDLTRVGGQQYIGSLVSNTPSAANIRRYADIVRDKAMRRELITACVEATEQLYAPNAEPGLIERLQEKLFQITNRAGSTRARSFPQILAEVVESIDRRHQSGEGDITGLETGFLDLDKMTAGFQAGDLVVIAGRPSMGKSAIAMNIVEHVTLKLGKACAVFSLEMSDSQLVQRMLGSVGRVNQHQLRTGRLTDEDWKRIAETHGHMGKARVVIEETYDLQPATLRAKARRIKRENPDLALIVVDYLQLMDGEGDKRVDVVAEITRGLKRIARELCIPVVALSQLNRSVEARTNKRPMLADLRESGAIEQDADVILFLYREEVYDPDTPNPGLCEVIVGKQRNGPTGVVHLTFLAQYARFENHAGEIYRKQPKARAKPFESKYRADVDG